MCHSDLKIKYKVRPTTFRNILKFPAVTKSDIIIRVKSLFNESLIDDGMSRRQDISMREVSEQTAFLP